MSTTSTTTWPPSCAYFNTSSTSTFNPSAQTNIAVYWGASPATTPNTLLTLCQNPAVDIVIIALLRTYFGPSGYPSLKIGGNSCKAASPAQQAIAPGLLDCTALAPSISQCQRNGKPVLLSLGGSTSTANFSSAGQAREFASTLWALFGADTMNSTTTPIRPYGTDVVLDGFDLDPENDMPEHYGAFTKALRDKDATNSSIPFYIPGAPHYPIPDTSLPLDAMLQFDLVLPRFYNAMKCNANGPGFVDSVSACSKELNGGGSNRPKLYSGIAVSNLTGSGSVVGEDLESYLSGINTAEITKFGGLMLWDGSLELAEDPNGVNFLTYAKEAVLKLQETVGVIDDAGRAKANINHKRKRSRARHTTASTIISIFSSALVLGLMSMRSFV